MDIGEFVGIRRRRKWDDVMGGEDALEVEDGLSSDDLVGGMCEVDFVWKESEFLGDGDYGFIGAD